jgi:hypothetical protein
MKILLLQPRLDCSFKEGNVPKVEGEPNHPLRLYWKLFFEQITDWCELRGHTLEVLKKPLWQFEPSDINQYDCDYALVPHKGKNNFHHPKALYYMQQALPWLFSIDPNGWQSHTKFYPLQPEKYEGAEDFFQKLKTNWTDKNNSKFAQPDIKVELPKDFIFFPCQIPHDESIKYHSDVSAVSALDMTCQFAIDKNIDLVIKPHPINPAAMASQKEVYNKYLESERIHWVENVSINQCLSECDSVFLVNSGTGLEAILHGKPIFNFGRADYDFVSWDATMVNELWTHREFKINLYPDFIATYANVHYDVADLTSFDKLEEYNEGI